MWDLEIGAKDPRVPQNLGLNSTNRTSWLTPLSQSLTRAEQLRSVQRLQAHSPHHSSLDIEHDPYFYDHNVLFVLFDQPINVAIVRCVLQIVRLQLTVNSLALFFLRPFLHFLFLFAADFSIIASPPTEA